MASQIQQTVWENTNYDSWAKIAQDYDVQPPGCLLRPIVEAVYPALEQEFALVRVRGPDISRQYSYVSDPSWRPKPRHTDDRQAYERPPFQRLETTVYDFLYAVGASRTTGVLSLSAHVEQPLEFTGPTLATRPTALPATERIRIVLRYHAKGRGVGLAAVHERFPFLSLVPQETIDFPVPVLPYNEAQAASLVLSPRRRSQ